MAGSCLPHWQYSAGTQGDGARRRLARRTDGTLGRKAMRNSAALLPENPAGEFVMVVRRRHRSCLARGFRDARQPSWGRELRRRRAGRALPARRPRPGSARGGEPRLLFPVGATSGHSDAPNLVPGDINGEGDAFVRDLESPRRGRRVGAESRQGELQDGDACGTVRWVAWDTGRSAGRPAADPQGGERDERTRWRGCPARRIRRNGPDDDNGRAVRDERPRGGRRPVPDQHAGGLRGPAGRLRHVALSHVEADECGIVMEQRTAALPCGDRFTQGGSDLPPLTERDVRVPARRFAAGWTTSRMAATPGPCWSSRTAPRRRRSPACTEAPGEATVRGCCAGWRTRSARDHGLASLPGLRGAGPRRPVRPAGHMPQSPPRLMFRSAWEMAGKVTPVVGWLRISTSSQHEAP